MIASAEGLLHSLEPWLLYLGPSCAITRANDEAVTIPPSATSVLIVCRRGTVLVTREVSEARFVRGLSGDSVSAEQCLCLKALACFSCRSWYP